MHDLPAKIENERLPPSLRRTLVKVVLPTYAEGDTIAIRITMGESGLPVRQLGYFLVLLDRLYARMHPVGVYAYAKSERSHLQIDRIERGSVEFVLQQLLTYLDPPRVILIWALLKYLPSIVLSVSTSVSNLAHAYKEYQEGVNLRLTNQNLKRRLASDESLAKLGSRDLSVLTRVMTYLYSRNTPLLLQAGKFVEKHIKSVGIETKKRQ